MTAQKLILSRKGFDTTSQKRGPKRGYSGVKRPYGGVPSPIFPDGSMYSLPVPGRDEDVLITYGDLCHEVGNSLINIGQVVEDLTQSAPTRWTSEDWTYVSPDIREPFQSNIQGQTGIVGAGGYSTRASAKTRRWQGRPVPILWVVPARGASCRTMAVCSASPSAARFVRLAASRINPHDRWGRPWGGCLVCGHGAVGLGL